ncbi:hypothetical protein ACI1UB_05170 [Lactococcus petauri]|uniref:hypothetical protein n=1 Tax=Lactococcus petauri TaxID=1940789 RepID=UPI003853CD1C
MSPEKKRKLRNIALLALLGLIGGTFAFTAFNQQAINDRLRENPVREAAGRVHDYFNRETENKDVFVENYGQEPIMARIRLSEFMEYQERGEPGFEQLVGGSRQNVSTWEPYIPAPNDITTRLGDGAVMNTHARLTFGREGERQWYLPTFNHDKNDLMTAAAGDARDYVVGEDPKDGRTNGATHPGDGKDGYWQENVSYTNSENGILWPGSTEGTRTTSRNLRQERAPMTLQQWVEDGVGSGNFWVIDHVTGWAYWANALRAGQATSYLIDAAVMQDAAHAINGAYYYAIHVDSQLIDMKGNFETEIETPHLDELLEAVRVSAGISVRELDFSTIEPGDIFTRGDQDFRYLGNMEDIAAGSARDHMIILNGILNSVNWTAHESRIDDWFDNELPADLKAMVTPVANDFITGEVRDSAAGLTTNPSRWLANNLTGDVAADRTVVVEDGMPRAFSLSLADVDHLSRTDGIGFTHNTDRRASDPLGGWWWLRTPSDLSTVAWSLTTSGTLNGSTTRTNSSTGGGARPALIIHQ